MHLLERLARGKPGNFSGIRGRFSTMMPMCASASQHPASDELITSRPAETRSIYWGRKSPVVRPALKVKEDATA